MDITVRIVGVVDRASLVNPLRSLEQDYDRVYKRAAGAARKSAKEQAEVAAARARDQAASAGAAYRQSGRQIDDNVTKVDKSEKQKLRIIERANAEALALRIRSYKRESAALEREERTRARTQVAERRQAEARGRAMTRDWGRSVMGGVGTGARAVLGGVGEAARGAGLDPTIAGLVNKVVTTEAAATRATLSGFAAMNAARKQQGKSAVSPTKSDVDSTLAAVQSAGDATSTSYSSMAQGLEAFVSKASDLEGGKAMLQSIGKIAKATGVDFVELAGAAGDISATMGDVPDKAKKLEAALRLVATQGAQGTVEIKDLATYMPRLAAPAATLSGDYNTNLGELGTIAQMSKFAGRSTAAEQTNSAAQLVNDLTNKQSLKRMKGAGIDVFDGQGRVRSMREIIQDTYAKTGGDVGKISSLFINKNSAAAVKGFMGAYRGDDGGPGGAAGIDAVFKKFSASMSANDVDAAAAVMQGSKESRVQDANNRMQAMMGDALIKVVPALEKLAPAAGKVADALIKMVDFGAENPGLAISGAIVASITKASIGSAITSALMGPTGIGGASAGAAGSVAALGAASALAAVAWGLAVDQLIKMLPELEQHEKDKEGQTQDEITNAFRQGATPMVDGERVAVTGRDKNGRWLTEPLLSPSEDPEGFDAQRKKTQEVMELWKPRLDADAEMKDTLARTRVGSKEWMAANPGVDPSGKAPSQLRFADSSSMKGDSAVKNVATSNDIAQLTAALKAGVRVTNLNEIKLQGGGGLGGGDRVDVVP